MKKFENPAIEVISVMVEDVIATSSTTNPDPDNNTTPDDEL